MAANSLLDLTPLRSPSPQDRQQLIQAAKQHMTARQWSFLHQHQQLQAKRKRITRPGAPTASRPSQLQRSATMMAVRPLVALNYQIWSLQYSDKSAQKLTSADAVAQLFQQEGVDGRLLILGEPGTGKSQTLCALGVRLLEKIRPQDPVPVLFDVTGWKGQELRPWLIDQLWIHYRVPRSCAESWLDGGRLVLLIDGFDSLPSSEQRSCAKAIDTLMRSNMDQAIALCCQRQAMERTGITFSYFNGGVHIVPFAAQQVKDYVVGLDRLDLWKGIKASKSLQHLARFPLMLNLLVESYDGTPATNRNDLIQQFVSAQLDENIGQARSAQQADKLKRFLGWLARQLGNRDRTFTLDVLDPTWLPSSQRLLYRLLLSLALMLVIGGISGSLLMGLAIGIVAAQVDVDHFFRYRLSLASLRGGAWGPPLVTGVLLGAVLAIPLGGLIGTVVARFGQGITAGLYSAAAGATLGFLGGLLFQSWGGLHHAIHSRQHPNQDLVAAFFNGVLLAVIYGGLLLVTVSLTAMVSGQPAGDLLDGSALRQLVAIAVGLVLWASYAIQHVILRGMLTLSSQGAVPLSPVALLNEAVERKLMQRVEGGYSFIHEQIREHFALIK